MVVGGVLLYIQLGIRRHIGFKRRLPGFIAVQDFQKAIRRDSAAVGSRQLLGGIQALGNVPDFAICTQAETLVLFENFCQVNLHLLALVGDVRLSGGELRMLARIT